RRRQAGPRYEKLAADRPWWNYLQNTCQGGLVADRERVRCSVVPGGLQDVVDWVLAIAAHGNGIPGAGRILGALDTDPPHALQRCCDMLGFGLVREGAYCDIALLACRLVGILSFPGGDDAVGIQGVRVERVEGRSSLLHAAIGIGHQARDL